MLKRVPFATSSSKRAPLTSEKLVNLFVEKAPQDAKAGVMLLNSPGQVEFCNLADIRGLHKMDNLLYAVAGTSLYSVSAAGVSVSLGTISGEGAVYMADNGLQLCIVAEPDGFIYTIAAGLVEITDPDFEGASCVDYLDGFFLFAKPDSGQFFISTLYDGTDFDALDFVTAESHPDDLVRILADHREVWLFGEQSTEVWYNGGGASFPFERNSSAIMEKGTIAPHSVTKMDNSVFWLGDDMIVWRAQGYEPVRISTHGVETDISNVTDPENAIGFTYVQEGHTFYVLTFPGSQTLVFDASTGAWHDRKTYGVNDWTPNSAVFCYNKNLVGSTKIFELDVDINADDGADIVAEIVTVPYGDNTGQTHIMRQFQLDMETGVGLATGQGIDPVAMLQFSDDGGKTWSDEIWRDIGAVGAYTSRAVWRRLGKFRVRTLRIRISDPVKRKIMGGFVDIGA